MRKCYFDFLMFFLSTSSEAPPNLTGAEKCGNNIFLETTKYLDIQKQKNQTKQIKL